MADPAKRAQRWRAKYNIERVKGALEDQQQEMAARYEAAAARLVSMENQVRQVLNDAGVSSILVVPYLNFGRQLYKLTAKGTAGNSCAMAAKILLDKWQARGCDPEVLATIRSEVFNIGEPAI